VGPSKCHSLAVTVSDCPGCESRHGSRNSHRDGDGHYQARPVAGFKYSMVKFSVAGVDQAESESRPGVKL
jgi:hypothetical protein